MNLFKSYTFTWWQIGIFKLALLAIGILIGSIWSEVFVGYFLWLLIIAVVASGYIMYVSLRS